MKLLNLGCDAFKIPNFINIDINEKVQPDLCIDLNNILEYFEEFSIDYIYAGHVLEHLEKDKSINLLKNCFKLLKSFGTIIVVVPDYTKCGNDIELSEKIIFGEYQHKLLFNKERLSDFFKLAGFNNYFEVPLEKVPYIIVSDIYNPKPEPWQTAFLGLKTWI